MRKLLKKHLTLFLVLALALTNMAGVALADEETVDAEATEEAVEAVVDTETTETAEAGGVAETETDDEEVKAEAEAEVEANTEAEVEAEAEIDTESEMKTVDSEATETESASEITEVTETESVVTTSVIATVSDDEDNEDSEEDIGVVASGTCGDDVTWTLDSDGLLTISGTGAMDDYYTQISESTASIKHAPWYNYSESVIRVVIEDGVTTVGSGAFYDYYTSLTSVVISDSVLSIGEYAFECCSNLKSVSIGNGVTEIGEYAFYYCSSLTDVVIPESVISIGTEAFAYCTLLTRQIKIPSSVESIGKRAFAHVAILTQIIFEGDAPEISDYTFYDVESTVYYPANNDTWTEDVMQDYGGTITWIAYESSEDILELEDTDIIASGTCGDDLTWTLDSGVLDGNGVLTISGTGTMTDYAYSDDTAVPWYKYRTAISSVVINEGVTSVGGGAFASCNLTEVELPLSLESIGDYAFSGCASLTEVNIPKSVTSIGVEAFQFCAITSVVIPDGVTSIEYGTFWGCWNLESITIGNGVQSIGGYAFYSCASLESITIPEDIESIGEQAFYGCYSLTSVIISEGVVSIGDGAFLFCDGLTSVAVPSSVISIGEEAFALCESLEEIEVDENNEFYSSADGVLFNKTQTELVQYPTGKTATAYSVPDGVICIGNRAFAYCRYLTSLYLPNSITTIGSYAVSSCDIKKIIFEGDAPSFGDDAFLDVSATAYYPTDNDTWTEDIMQDYSGTITWVAYAVPGYTLVSSLSVSTDISVYDLLTDEELSSGSTIDYVLSVEDATDSVTEEEQAAILAEAGNVIGIYYLSIDLAKYVDGEEVDVTETISEITITITIPDSVIEAAADTTGSYCIVRYHEGEAEILDVEYDAEANTLTFSTNKFSAYAIAYVGDTDDNYIAGDVNGDGDVDILDVIRLLRYANGEEVEVVVGSTDVNSDGEVDIIDVIRLLKYVNEEIDSL